MHVRIIQASSTKHCQQERVIFTQDFETPASDFFPDGFTIDDDGTTYADISPCFPLESVLIKED